MKKTILLLGLISLCLQCRMLGPTDFAVTPLPGNNGETDPPKTVQSDPPVTVHTDPPVTVQSDPPKEVRI